MRALILLAWFFVGAAVAAPVTVQTMIYKGKIGRDGGELTTAYEEISMPFVTSTDIKLATKINQQLFMRRLKILTPVKLDKFFSVPSGTYRNNEVRELNFEVKHNDGKILTIEFNTMDWDHAHAFSNLSVFELREGRELSPEDLLDRQGRINSNNRLRKAYRAAYREAVANLKKELSELKKSVKIPEELAEQSQEYVDAIAAHSECAGESEGTNRTPNEQYESGDIYHWDLLNKEFSLSESRCMIGVDDSDRVNGVTITIPYTELEPQMTAYGKTLLLNKGTAIPPNSIYGVVLKGFLGTKTAVSMLLNKDSNNDISGFYFYDKYQKPIAVSGKEMDGKLELSEQGDDQVEHLRFHLTVLPNGLQGRWVGDKEFDFNVAF